MRAAELILIRHGESEWNARGLWQGQADPPLSTRGRAQAQAGAPALAALAPDALYASDLRRALETARILGRAVRLEPGVEPGLRELHVGAWSGLSKAEIEARWPGQYARFWDGDLELRAGGGETRREFEARIRAALDAIARRHAGSRVAVVCHGGVVLTLTGVRLPNLGRVHLHPDVGAGWRVVERPEGVPAELSEL